MVCNKSNKPHGFGRAIKVDKYQFYDGQFKDGVPHGYIRYIH